VPVTAGETTPNATRIPPALPESSIKPERKPEIFEVPFLDGDCDDGRAWRNGKGRENSDMYTKEQQGWGAIMVSGHLAKT
jgi:hypothetical protein